MHMFVFLIPVVAIVAVFTFVAVAAWSDNRRKERETYYRHETYRKVLEHGESAQPVLDLMRQEETQRARRRVEGMKLGGLITAAVGVGLMVFLYTLEKELAFVGLIPLLIGLVLAFFAFFVAKQNGAPPPSGAGSDPSR